MVSMRWGLVPHFIKGLEEIKDKKYFNARSETITQRQTWRKPIKKRRCLVPVSAFYEWDEYSGTPRKPYFLELSDASMMALAGIWDAWKGQEGRWVQSFSIVTTASNNLMAKIHPRMPVILHKGDYDRWLSRDVKEQPPLDLLRPYESGGDGNAPCQPTG